MKTTVTQGTDGGPWQKGRGVGGRQRQPAERESERQKGLDRPSYLGVFSRRGSHHVMLLRPEDFVSLNDHKSQHGNLGNPMSHPILSVLVSYPTHSIENKFYYIEVTLDM
jgi:hypothetical protein